MVGTNANILDNQVFEGYGETHNERITALLRDMSDEDLALFQTRSKEEQDRRLSEAEEKLAAMKKAFGLSEKPRVTSKLTTDSAIPSPRHKQSKKAKSSRTPRGKAKELILAFLKEGPKGRKQIESYLAQHGIATTSVGTLLNRLKKDAVIEHDKVNKVYLNNQVQSDVHDSSATK